MAVIRALIGSFLLFCHAAQAQSIAYLLPDSFDPTVGAELGLSLQRQDASGVKAVPWPDNLRWFFVRVGGTQENRDQAGPSWPLAHPGVTMIGFDIIPTITAYPAEQFAKFLSGVNAVSTPVGRARPGDVRVRRFEAVKMIVNVRADGPPAFDPPTATGKAGQQTEIRPLFDPATILAGADLPLRVYADGDSRAACQVFATHVPSGRRDTITTDAKGIGLIRNIVPGEWRIEFAYAVQLSGDSQADWDLWTTTLTFQVPAAEVQK